jgi:primosomal protein N' (replication factor Y) (superfamily II helicase)
MTFVRIGLDVPVSRLFEYSASDATAADVGRCVRVPFGRRSALGVILDIASASTIAAERVKPVSAILRDAPGFSAADLRLLRFAADYYHYPLGQAVMAALPGRLKRGGTPPPVETSYALTSAGRDATVEMLPQRAAVQRRLLSELMGREILSAAEVREVASGAMAALKSLMARGWIERRDPATPAVVLSAAEPQRDLLPAQQSALETMRAGLHGFRTFLLHGVTGSGKTEVYLRLAQSILASGRQVLMLVPEIALTPQLEAMVQGRFPSTVLARLHSGLGEGERMRNWLAAQSGEARLVLGTRLAVFAPLPELGLIVVDEEHDTSFKQTEGFCYSARDMAVVRARQVGVPIVLGSATPSLESYHNARTGRYTLVSLRQRVNARSPTIDCIPLGRGHFEDGIAPALLDAIAAHLARAEQSLIFINRRGYSPVLMCHSCGWLSECHRCSAHLVLHLAVRELHCHHCGYQTKVPESCPTCGDPALAPVGQGTQRIEATLTRCFPEARILRIDRDSTRRKDAWSDMRRRIHAREVDILVGTQMLAKGHDFPHLALVGVLNADSVLYSADFRASERLYALLTQVSGRAGRAAAAGRVLIQTEFADHPVYTALREQNAEAFFEALLEERRAAQFPPFVHQALLRAEAPQVEVALDFLERAKHAGAALAENVALYDPVPASMVRLAGRERAQLLVQSGSRPNLHGFLRAWTAKLAEEKASVARWALDVDPLEL